MNEGSSIALKNYFAKMVPFLFEKTPTKKKLFLTDHFLMLEKLIPPQRKKINFGGLSAIAGENLWENNEADNRKGNIPQKD